jgi:selenocysteine lyase/cysteine desulfurase
VGISGVENVKVAEYLWDRKRIMVTPITHAEFSGVRVTPNVYTTLREVDVFAEAVEGILRHGLAA